jgi:hypothetical protein
MIKLRLSLLESLLESRTGLARRLGDIGLSGEHGPHRPVAESLALRQQRRD